MLNLSLFLKRVEANLKKKIASQWKQFGARMNSFVKSIASEIIAKLSQHLYDVQPLTFDCLDRFLKIAIVVMKAHTVTESGAGIS